MKLKVVESLAVIKARKWIIFKWWQLISKIFREADEFWVWYTSIFTRKNKKWQRIKERGAWTSEAGNCNESWPLLTGTTTVTANDGNNATVMTKQAVKTYILTLFMLFNYNFGLASISGVVSMNMLTKK